LIRERSEASKLLIGFIAMVKNQFNKWVKVVRGDNGAEFTSGLMQEFYLEHGILRESSCVDTPQQNGRQNANIAKFLMWQGPLDSKPTCQSNIKGSGSSQRLI